MGFILYMLGEMYPGRVFIIFTQLVLLSGFVTFPLLHIAIGTRSSTDI